MRIEVSAKIYGRFILKESIAVKLHPYDFKIFLEGGLYYISISEKVIDYKPYITKYQDCNGIKQLTLTASEIYEDTSVRLKLPDIQLVRNVRTG
jgi:hypothetical protein